MFTRRANGFGAVGGALISVVLTAMIKLFTPLHWATYLPIAILSCMLGGYLLSFCSRQRKDLRGLTGLDRTTDGRSYGAGSMAVHVS